MLSSGGEEELALLTDEQMQLLESQAAEASRLLTARMQAVETRHHKRLLATGAELSRLGAVSLRTTAGDIHSRVIRFRNGGVVLEMVYLGGWSQSRSTESTVAEACVHGLAYALAQMGPNAEPLGG
jgi:hypothetical protein